MGNDMTEASPAGFAPKKLSGTMTTCEELSGFLNSNKVYFSLHLIKNSCITWDGDWDTLMDLSVPKTILKEI